jgi:hypothetical protein
MTVRYNQLEEEVLGSKNKTSPGAVQDRRVRYSHLF